MKQTQLLPKTSFCVFFFKSLYYLIKELLGYDPLNKLKKLVINYSKRTFMI